MSKKGGNDKKAKKGSGKSSSSSSSSGKSLIDIDPETIYFTHSRVRPFFTGCNKRIEDTLQEIANGTTQIKDIPMITVIPNEGCYFSLNNRRLFLFKTLRSMGLLPNNTITAFVKAPLEREKQRYLPTRCALTAKLMKEHRPGEKEEANEDGSDNDEDPTNEEKKEEPELISNSEEKS